jgi:predicted nuclease with TOPRIM domain
MQKEIQQRLETLRTEFEKGQTRLQELQQQQSQLHETLLRIGGAIQVLTELLEKETSDHQNKDPVMKSDKTES